MRETSARRSGVLLLVVGLVVGCATGASRGRSLAAEDGGGGPGPWAAEAHPRETWERTWEEALARCGPASLPEGWPRRAEDDAEALLAPFLECASGGDFLALQEGVDMPLLVERLGPWHAVRLGALGPVRADAVALLNRQRAAFLVDASERYGVAYAQVLALFVLHSTYDDELREVLGLLAREGQLAQTLGAMPAVREELEARGLGPSAWRERDFQWRDVGRGLGRAARDALASGAVGDGARYMDLWSKRQRLPPPYQRALEEVEHALTVRHFAPGQVALGGFDSLTFGVPLGFYGLVAGTGQGLSSLVKGEYEQATRELAPAALWVALHTGTRGARAWAGVRGTSGGTGARGLLEPRLRALRDLAAELETRLGVEGLRELAGYLRARREAGELVAVGGMEAALALHEARGDVARAQAWMAQAERPGRTPGTSAIAHRASLRDPALSKSLTSLVDEGAGLTPEVLRARLAGVEGEAALARLPVEMAVLERQWPLLEAPAPGAQGHPLWAEYVAYYEQRLGEMRQGRTTRGPLTWEGYERMRGLFARGLAYERTMVELLRADAALPRAQRRWLRDFESPRVETYVGVWKPESGLRFADVLVIEQQPPPPGQPPRVETFSFKSRDLSLMDEKALKTRMVADAGEAWAYYGDVLDIRRPSLRLLLPSHEVIAVQRVRLFYEGGRLRPGKVGNLGAIGVDVQQAVPGVSVWLQ